MVFFSFSSELFHLLSLSITTTIQHDNKHRTRFAKICSLQRRSLLSPLQLSYSACPCLSRVFRLPTGAAANCNLHQQTPPTTTAQLRHSPLPAILLLYTLSRLDTHIHSTKPSTRQHSRRTVLLANDCATPTLQYRPPRRIPHTQQPWSRAVTSKTHCTSCATSINNNSCQTNESTLCPTARATQNSSSLPRLHRT